jgi:RsiW-degrading membrane proteinase PrsW (M82 family)
MTAARPPAQPSRQKGAQVHDLLPLGDWIRHHSLRSWPVLLFLLLICVPTIALVILGANPSARTFDSVAWIFAAYFGLAWLLLLGVIIRPEHVTRLLLVVVTAIALVVEIPLAVTLETVLHASNAGLGHSIYSVGIPEELAKAIPVLVIAIFYVHRRSLEPRDYLFLGAVSGLVFGASEVVHYFTINGVVEFYLTVKAALPSIQNLINSGHSTSTSLFAVLIGPVRYFILNFVWRFLTDSITHACWAGLTGYFIGLAVSGRHKWYTVGWIGLVIAAILHGLNDWGRVNGHPVWILVTLVSGILFLGYAKVGSRAPLHLFADEPHPGPRHATPAAPSGQAAGTAAGSPPAAPGHPGVPERVPAGRRVRPWWEH